MSGTMKRTDAIASLYLIILLGLSSVTCAQSRLEDTYNAKVIGKGGAGVAGQHSGAGMLYNPAFLGRPRTVVQYENHDMNQEQFNQSNAQFYQFGTLGIGFASTTGKELVTRASTYIGYGQSGKNNVDWGLLYKSTMTARPTADQTREWGVDLGVLYRMSKSLSAGIVGYNVIKSVGGPSLGGAAGFYWKNTLVNLAGEVTVIKTSASSVGTRWGADLPVSQGFTLRGGWGDHHWTMGASVVLGIFDTTFAARYPEGDSDHPVYAISVTIGKDDDDDTRR